MLTRPELKRLPDGVEAKARIVELKADAIAEDGTIEGYLSVFGNIDGGGDIIMPGAFDASLAKARNRPIPILREHNPEKVIGIWSSLTPDNYGLKARGKIIDTELGTETLKVARAGFPFGLSIGYVTVRHEIDKNLKTDWGWPARKLIEVDLWEGSVVTFAMNELCGIESVKRRVPQTNNFAPLIADLKAIAQPSKPSLAPLIASLRAI